MRSATNLCAACVLSVLLLASSGVAFGRPIAYSPAAPAEAEHNVSKGVEVQSDFGGRPASVAVRSGLAYFTRGLNLEIFDVANPASPIHRGILLFDNYPFAITLDGSYAYVAVGADGLRIVDVSDPDAPVEASRLSWAGGSVRHVAVQGSYAYVALCPGGLAVVDIANPRAPRIVGTFPDARLSITGYDLAVVGSYLYLGSVADGLRIIDIANPASPSLVNTYLAGEITDIAIAGATAYVASPKSGLSVADISNPAQPRTLGTLSTPIQDLVVSGSYVYTSHYYGDFMLRIVDVGDPAQPHDLASLKTYATTAAIDGSTLYIPNPLEGIQIVDVSQPAAPQQIAVLPTFIVNEVASEGDLTFLATDKGLRIIDSAAPSNPREVGSFSTELAGHVMAAGRYVYATFSYDQPQYRQETKILDVSAPSSPRQVGMIPTGGKLAAADGYLYIGDQGWAGLHVVDIRDAANPHEVALVPGYAGDVIVAGRYLFVAGGNDGVRVLDVSDPTKPRQVAAFQCYTYDIAMQGNLLYIGSPGESAAPRGASGVYVVDVSDPTKPTQRGFFAGYAWSIAVAGQYAYFDTWSGASVVDVSDPANIRLAGSYFKPSYAIADIYAEGDRVFIAAGSVALLKGTGLSIAGQIKSPSGEPYAAGKVELDDGRTVALDAKGRFELDGLTVGTYTVRPVSAGVQFSPPSQTITISLSDASAPFVSFTSSAEASPEPKAQLFLPLAVK